jgi:hypothetical protein
MIYAGLVSAKSFRVGSGPIAKEMIIEILHAGRERAQQSNLLTP